MAKLKLLTTPYKGFNSIVMIGSWQDFGVNIPDNEPPSMTIPNWKDTADDVPSKKLKTMASGNRQESGVNVAGSVISTAKTWWDDTVRAAFEGKSPPRKQGLESNRTQQVKPQEQTRNHGPTY